MRLAHRLLLGCFFCLLWMAYGTRRPAPSALETNTVVADHGHKLLEKGDRLAFLHNWPDAGPIFAAAERIFAQSGNKRDELYAHIGRLRGFVETLSLPEVSDEFSAILKMPIAQTDARLRLLCLVAKGDVDFQIDPQSSREDWEAVSTLAKHLGDAVWENRALAELGTIAFYNSEIFRAMHMVGRSYIEAERQNDSTEIIRNLAALGEGFAEFGHSEDALRFFEKAIQMARATPDAEVPFTAQLGKARMLIVLKRTAEGKKMLDAALRDACEKRMQVREARVRLVLGNLAQTDGDLPQAASHLERVTAIATNDHLYRLLASATSKLAILYAQQGNKTEEAIALAKVSVGATRQGGDSYHLPQLLAVVAEQQAGRGHLLEAERTYQKALSFIDQLLVHVPTFQDKNVLIGTLTSVYKAYFRFAIERLHDPREAFHILEQAHGRGIADFMRNVAAAGRQPASESGISDVNSLVRGLLKPIHFDLRSERDPSKREKLQWLLWEREKRVLIAGDRDQWKGLEHAHPVDLAAFQANLRRDEVVLEYSLAEPTSTVLVIDHENISSFSLPGSAKLNALIDAFVAEVLARRSGEEQAKQLYSLLFGPIHRRYLRNRFIIIPDGKLQSLPFEALLDSEGHFLLVSHVITYAPSATVEHSLSSSHSAHVGDAPLLFVGDVRYEGGLRGPALSFSLHSIALVPRLFEIGDAPHFVQLPGSRDEVLNAARVMGPDSVILLGEQATEASLKSQPLARYRALHFATHGVVNPEFPDRSALILGDRPDSPEDGLLQAREIARLPLDADLVTISACDMAIGKPRGAAGNASIVESFLFAGARAVVASLWDVDDNFTAYLMRRFYQHLSDGVDKGSSLRQAKLDLMHEFGSQVSPFRWAGFEMFGDGRYSLTPLKGDN